MEKCQFKSCTTKYVAFPLSAQYPTYLPPCRRTKCRHSHSCSYCHTPVSPQGFWWRGKCEDHYNIDKSPALTTKNKNEPIWWPPKWQYFLALCIFYKSSIKEKWSGSHQIVFSTRISVLNDLVATRLLQGLVFKNVMIWWQLDRYKG